MGVEIESQRHSSHVGVQNKLIRKSFVNCAVTNMATMMSHENQEYCVLPCHYTFMRFTYENLNTKSHDARIKYIPGADPVMHLYDEEGKEVKKVDVAEMNRDSIKYLIESHGLKRSDTKMKEEEQEEEQEEEDPLPPYDESQEDFPEEEEEDTEESPTEEQEGDEATPKEKEEL